MSAPQLILASASPRRREILQMAGYDFRCVPCGAEECTQGADARTAALLNAQTKAQSVSRGHEGAVVLGCDTVVCLDGRVLLKPKSRRQAFEMLSALSAREHTVYSGVCVTDGKRSSSFVSSSVVRFYPLDEQTINSYIDSGEPMDKAGAYGIQGLGSILIERLEGSFFTVMGLPIAECARLLAEYGVFCKIKLPAHG